MRRAPAAAEPIPVTTMTASAIAAISMGQLSAQSPPAVPTREHQSGGQPTSRPAHDRALERSPPRTSQRRSQEALAGFLPQGGYAHLTGPSRVAAGLRSPALTPCPRSAFGRPLTALPLT